MGIRIGRLLVAAVLLGGLGAVGWAVRERLLEEDAPKSREKVQIAAPVETAEVRREAIELRRTFSGTLEAPARFVVAPKVAARVESVEVDLADTVRRGDLVVVLDDDELQQAVAQSRADLAVARANLAQGKSALETARRALQRIETLSGKGVASDVQLDAARADESAESARVEVAAAQVTRAEAALEAARIQLGYARIHAEWTGGSDERVVSDRHVDPGDTVSPGDALLDVVELDDVTAVIFVAERDYARLTRGQPVALVTDAYPGETFNGAIARIAPVFRQSTRQARVEVNVPNPGRRLKPGMFVRATVVLDRVESAVVVPEEALTTRDGTDGVFLVDAATMTAVWRPVTVGIREDGRVEIVGGGVEGRVITLGQQLVEDGAAVSVPDAAPPGSDGDGAGGADAPEGAPE